MRRMLTLSVHPLPESTASSVQCAAVVQRPQLAVRKSAAECVVHTRPFSTLSAN